MNAKPPPDHLTRPLAPAPARPTGPVRCNQCARFRGMYHAEGGCPLGHTVGEPGDARACTDFGFATVHQPPPKTRRSSAAKGKP